MLTRIDKVELQKAVTSIGELIEALPSFTAQVDNQLDMMNWNDSLRPFFNTKYDEINENLTQQFNKLTRIKESLEKGLMNIAAMEEDIMGMISDLKNSVESASMQTAANSESRIDKLLKDYDGIFDEEESFEEDFSTHPEYAKKSYEHEEIANLDIGESGLTVADLGMQMVDLGADVSITKTGLEIITIKDYTLEIDTVNTAVRLIKSTPNGEKVIVEVDGDYMESDELAIIDMLVDIGADSEDIKIVLGPDTFGTRFSRQQAQPDQRPPEVQLTPEPKAKKQKSKSRKLDTPIIDFSDIEIMV